ncbi:MAG: GDSL-type esterase/lipase family protein [Bacteroidia bacterium]
MNLRYTLYIFLFSLCISLTAQNKTYPFINYNMNKLFLAKDSSLMLSFYKKIDELVQGKRSRVTIAHYGGSHVQAGIWTETIKANFQEINNFQGGGSFAFPFKMAKTNSPNFYKSFSTGNWKRSRSVNKEQNTSLGMAGIAVASNDSAATFGIHLLENKNLKNFSTIRVYHNFNSSFKFYVSPFIAVKYIREDLPEKGYTRFSFQTPIDSVMFEMTRMDTNLRDFVLYGYSLENDLPGFYFAGIGVNGASTSSYLRCSLFVEQLSTIKPDLVIFSLGVNDVQGKSFSPEEYIANYDSLVTLVKKSSPDCAILFTTISDNYVRRKTPNKKSITVEKAIYTLMEKHNAAVWDMFAVMGGYKSIYKWYKAGLAARDKVHFNGKGYTIVGNLMSEAILNSYRVNSKLKHKK